MDTDKRTSTKALTNVCHVATSDLLHMHCGLTGTDTKCDITTHLSLNLLLLCVGHPEVSASRPVQEQAATSAGAFSMPTGSMNPLQDSPSQASTASE